MQDRVVTAELNCLVNTMGKLLCTYSHLLLSLSYLIYNYGRIAN